MREDMCYPDSCIHPSEFLDGDTHKYHPYHSLHLRHRHLNLITGDSLRATIPDANWDLAFDRFERKWIVGKTYEEIVRMQREG